MVNTLAYKMTCQENIKTIDWINKEKLEEKKKREKRRVTK